MTLLDQEHLPSLAPRVIALAERLRSHTPQSRLSTARRIESLCAAARLLLDDRYAPKRSLQEDLRVTTGLSAPMIAWGLETTLNSVQSSVLHDLALASRTSSYCQRLPPRLAVVILANNVFSSALRALFLPLLAGAPVLVKTPGADGAFARALKAALDDVDAALGERLEVVSFGREDSAATTALLSAAEVVSAYGDDRSLEAIARKLPKRVRFLPHGHGVSAAYISADQLSNRRRARDTADRVALDVVAYDQRGCLSPHAIFVESDSPLRLEKFAELLVEESLPLLSELLPRGTLRASEQAAALQWRAVAAVRGRLFASQSYAVSVEEGPVRLSPGGRQVGIYPCSSPAELAELLSPFQQHLKCVGIAASGSQTAAVADRLRRLGAPPLCRVGEMQTPPFDAQADGRAPLEGLLEFRDLH